ncbi:MAG: FtsX-like permease family protein [Rudaea sp.]|uniref:ABC transporter permease n=1 Tax=unclassified Rudaea TaxID=2627037 RepID=UPI0010F85D75|nr:MULTISPECIES: FtsX-like permease family protein [unclassified Rudaea]MBN8887227.1 FtsX-like permease family protein [Rudaea sp.]
MKPLTFAARSLRREFFHAELAMLALALVLAVAALTAVATLASRVEHALLASAAELIGGDLSINASRALPPNLIDEANTRGLRTSRLADFPSVVFAGEASRLVDVRASDDTFPLRGVLAVRDANGAEREVHAPPSGSVYVEPAVLDALALKIGGKIQVGGRDLVVAGEITRSPDSGSLFRLAPRVMMSLTDAQTIGLLAAGSRVRNRLLVAGPEDAVAEFASAIKPKLPDAAEIVTIADAQQNLSGAFERGGNFMRLAALLAALLSGIAIALAAQRFARRKREEVALLRCLGASRGEILQALLLELVLLALPACLLGVAAGLGLQQIVFTIAGDLLPGTRPDIPWQPSLAAFAIGVAVLFGFALPPLLRLREVEPMRVFRRDDAHRAGRFDALYLLPVAVAAALIAIGAGDTQLALTLGLGFTGVAALSLVLGLVLLRIVRGGGRLLPGALRFGLANLARRRALTLLQAGALALSLTAFAVLAVIGPSLLASWRAELPSDAPNYFLINLQDDQRVAMQERLAALGATNLNMLPLAVGKLVAINGKTPKPEDYSDRRAANWINGETRLSWSGELPVSNKLLQGRWFDADARGDAGPQVSVDKMWVDMFHLKLGDTLTLRVGEREVVATITSIRGVRWDSFRVNFFLMLDARTGADLAHSTVASFHLPRAVSLAALSRDFANVSLIDLNQLLDRVREIIGRVSSAVISVLGFSLAAGLLVLLAALAATADERRFESALLRTLGAHSGQLSAAVLGEFAALGLVAGGIAALGSAAIGYTLALRVFRFDGYVPPFASLLLVVFTAAALVALAGWLATRRIARTPPIAVLRQG